MRLSHIGAQISISLNQGYTAHIIHDHILKRLTYLMFVQSYNNYLPRFS